MGRIAKLGVQQKANGKWQIVGLYVPDADSPSGFRRHRPVYDTKAEALDEVEKLNKRKFEEGLAANRLNDDDRMDAIRAKDILEAHGVRLEDAARHYSKHLEATKRSISFTALKDEFLTLKKREMDAGVEGAIKPVDYRDIKPRFERFAIKFGDRLVEEIQKQDIIHWLDDLKFDCGALNRSNFRKVLSRIFAYAESRGYCSHNPVREVPVIKVGKAKKPIFTADQMTKLLSHAPKELIPYIAIGGFAGLRPSEAGRLMWSDVRWSESDIFVDEHGKTGKRYVKILPNLARWLKPYCNAKGRVSPHDADRKATDVAKKAGILQGQWPQDVLRHSYATAHACYFRNEYVTSQQMGNSVQVLKKFYVDAIPQAAAAKWWKIGPSKGLVNK